MKERTVKVVVTVLLVVGSALFLMPFLVSVFMATKTPAELSTTLPFAPPKSPTVDNFRTVLQNPNLSFFGLFRNTLVIATIATIGTVFSSSLVAYAFARLRFVGRDRLFMILLSTMMLPGVVTMIPTYIMLKELRWVDSFLPLTVPAFLGGGAFNVFLLRQYLLGVPKELDEAEMCIRDRSWPTATTVRTTRRA